MTSGYPAYPNPTITEAVCDIHFRLPLEKVWRPSFPGELFKQIQNEYPEMEPVLEMGLQFEFGPLGTGTKFVPQRQKVRFKHSTETEQDRPGTWLVANDYISEGLLRSEPRFLLREEIHLDAENILIITLGDPKSDLDAGHRAIIFDIDRIVEREVPTGQEVLKQEMDHLHADVWEVFSSAKGEKLEALLKKNRALIQLLRSWREGDEQEQRS